MTKQRISPSLKVFAGIAATFVALPLVSILVRTPWSDLGNMLSQKSTRDALSISLQTSILCIRCAFGLATGPFSITGPLGTARYLHYADGFAPSCRGYCIAHRVRSSRACRTIPVRLVRHFLALHPHSSSNGASVCCHAVSCVGS